MEIRNKKKPTALNNENCEEHHRSNLALNSNVPRSQEDYITQVSEEIEGGVIKKLSQEFSRIENRILGALARLDDSLTKPLIQGHSGATPERSRNVFTINQGTNEDASQGNAHPEAGLFNNQTTQNSGQEDRHDMVTGVHEEVTYCSPSTFSGKQKKNRSTFQPQFRRENTPVTIGADQILLALQHLANWQTTTILQISITILTKFPNCQSDLRQRCPRSTGNLKSSSCLKIFSKRVSKFIIR